MNSNVDSYDTRLAELGARVGRLLAADLRTFFPQVVRERFTETSALADAMTDEALAALKRDTLSAAEELALSVERRLTAPSAWLGATPPVREGGTQVPLTEHPPVAEAVAEIEQTVTAFLRAQGLPAEPAVTYRLPMRFIDGDNLATLTMNVWKAVLRRHEHRLEQDAASAASAHGERRRRWDDA